mmetsp:Transcript_87173/g.241733  ORF Transcript_87173/g.241733 Transcript_87173/m.241733 type:complete len:209 (+) Transcript_87173:143-769(+)
MGTVATGSVCHGNGWCPAEMLRETSPVGSTWQGVELSSTTGGATTMGLSDCALQLRLWGARLEGDVPSVPRMARTGLEKAAAADTGSTRRGVTAEASSGSERRGPLRSTERLRPTRLEVPAGMRSTARWATEGTAPTPQLDGASTALVGEAQRAAAWGCRAWRRRGIAASVARGATRAAAPATAGAWALGPLGTVTLTRSRPWMPWPG